ncbi:helix-turn-helix domain-containing protein [Actinoplanes sp. LDG1-06]|uniref:Helix-turn-helix domain-containing protein n=1 Tax=Paractinoplanes ovalisporus TaxID=2810368 RepID=A0ABS2APU5_9ACTN|nr:helix-turn-helix domain-containing protein [Actinoplanes ovalisporus]MBM2621830.1 helix-turn-helix domain-containing protein [Actinoplanes ovalisporus]
MQPNKAEDELLTVEEVATMLKVPVGTVRTWRSNREGPPGFRVGKYVRYRRSVVEEFIAQRERMQILSDGAPQHRY